MRSGQREFERGVQNFRLCALVARRQYGKTTIASRIALKKMMKLPGHTVIFGSVKLDLGREIVRKESAEVFRAFTLLAEEAKTRNTRLEMFDAVKNDSVALLKPDDLAELYESSRLEARLYHSRTVYSRTKVVALTPDAVGESGDVILDEVGRGKRFREVMEAMMPIISSNRDYRAILTTTPPPDDTHYSFELLAPPVDAKFVVSPKGNWYRTDHGVYVLRIDAWDAYADGVALYDDERGSEITPEQSRARAMDKDAWDRNYACRFVIGGSAAIGLLELDNAQRKGVGECQCIQVADDSDFLSGLDFLRAKLRDGQVGIGVDWASTEKEGSNPTSVTVTEDFNGTYWERAVFVWKSANPDLQKQRLRDIVLAVADRGRPARRVVQDATGDRLFCRDVAKHLAGLVPVENLVESETIEIPGYDTPVTLKTYTTDVYVAAIMDNRVALPPERYLREDHRGPKKIHGLYTCEVSSDGKHGDTVASGKNSLRALTSSKGAIESMAGIKSGANPTRRPQFIPRKLRRAA